MKLEFNENGSVTVPLYDLVDAMDTDAKRQLVFHLACQEDIAKLVADTLVSGSFDDDDGQFWHGYNQLTEHRALLLSRVPEMASRFESDLKMIRSNARTDGQFDGIRIFEEMLLSRGYHKDTAHDLACEARDLMMQERKL